MIYKRGGWERHSDSTGSGSRVQWVGTIHNPTRVVCIDNQEILYDVTSENAPTSTTIGSVGFYPGENSPTFFGKKERLIVTDASAATAPTTVRYDTGANAIIIEAMPTELWLVANPPPAAYSCVHNGQLILGRGPVDFSNNLNNRIWFGLTAFDILSTGSGGNGFTNWDTNVAYWDVTNEVTGLASVQGVLLIFSPNNTERIIGYESPGTKHTSADMELQPFTNVGCLDARSIVQSGEAI